MILRNTGKYILTYLYTKKNLRNPFVLYFYLSYLFLFFFFLFEFFKNRYCLARLKLSILEVEKFIQSKGKDVK